jgi:hypothetical protein
MANRRIAVSPSGAAMIPSGAILQVAEANGMSEQSLRGTQIDGRIPLASFLPPGRYDFFVTLAGGSPYLYPKAGSVDLPDAGQVLLELRVPGMK